ncbi:YafY family transcriptional regulator [Eubacteriales bacterium OttesenSCG-928-A19]|nr:YafY family transcriptional regulator [Eubacteriales bacterium OttesenSCG-928-A19]
MKIQRLIALLTVLLQNDRVPATRLAEKFDVSVRTIYRDIETLESAGIPLVTYTGTRGGVGILEQYKIDKKLFTHDDIATLLTGLQTMSIPMSSGALNQTLEKVRSLMPQEKATAIEMNSRKLYIDMTPWASHPVFAQQLDLIKVALDQNRILSFEYETLKEQVSSRIVEPVQLVLKENQWYLRAWCREREDFRTFKLRRIRSLELLHETFVPRDFPLEVEGFKRWTHERMLEIELMIHPSLREQILDRCNEENMTLATDGRIHVRLNFVESDLGYCYLMQLGDRCECIAPAHVRQELIRRINKLREVYISDD